MSFWQSNSGKAITGNEQDSFVEAIRMIPDGTTAPALIKSFKFNELNPEAPFYEVYWKLVDGEFKNATVRQKIACFDPSPEKASRALNMLMRFFKLLNVPPTDNAPLEADLMAMQGKILGIKIQEWEINGKTGNWVSQIHIADANFITATGQKIESKKANTEYKAAVDSAFSRNKPATSGHMIDDDVPF